MSDALYRRTDFITDLLASFLTFTRYFYKVLNGREFHISNPPGRESHHITVAKALTDAQRNPNKKLCIFIPPGHGKSTMLTYWMAWCFAQYPDCQFMYISYSKSIAATHTEMCRNIIQTPEFRDLFGVRIKHDARGKEFFQTTALGACAAFGSSGGITGRNAGLPNENRFTGAVIMDDMHKPDEAHSDLIRQKVIRNFQETIEQRPRGINVPMIYIGQRVHEADLGAFLKSGQDGHTWEVVSLPALDACENPLYPEKDTKEWLHTKRQYDPYTFAAQHQQDPIPAGGGLFAEEDFPALYPDQAPEIICTFITADSAETAKEWNDATVFSFWGLYEITHAGKPTGKLGLHWLDMWEIRVEPAQLEDEFMQFYHQCCLYSVPPHLAAIEKKSTGVTLSSVLKSVRGLNVRQIDRTAASGSKSDRFISMQQYIKQKLISFDHTAKHMRKCVEHMTKITANESHRFDDICDTAYDAIQIALVDRTLYNQFKPRVKKDDAFARALAQEINLRGRY